MRTTILVTGLAALLGGSLTATAQSTFTYRAQVTAEAGGTLINTASPLVPAGAQGWTDGSLFAATGAGSWEPGGRLRLAGGLALTGLRGGDVRLRVREAYGRVSATDWMDVEAGKRLVRWGVGYGFAPAGVLDPPRLATDPTDRLGVNEGRPMGRVDLFRGETSLTVATAGSSRVTAARLRTVLSGGVEVAVIASAAPGAGPSWGGTITHVVGQQLEWHAEVIEQDALGSRAVSAVAGAQRAVSGVVGAQRAVSGVVGAQRAVSGVVGAQYTFLNGVNVVVEYHRNGRALEGRRQALFMRAARSIADAGLAPEVILIAGLDDGSRTLVPGITWTPTGRVRLHARATRLLGGRRSLARLAPWSTSLTAGATVRF
jgi:hypothetical protein